MRAAVGFLALGLIASAAAMGQGLRIVDQRLSTPVHGPLAAMRLPDRSGAWLMVPTRRDEQRQFDFYAVDRRGLTPQLSLTMPEAALYYDLGAVPDGQALFFLAPEGVYRDAGQGADLVARTTSLYRLPGSPAFLRDDFAKDLTGDGLADLLVQDFQQLRVFVQQSDGAFTPVADLPVPARRRGSFDDVVYTNYPVYSGDATGDGRPDLLVRRDFTLLVFEAMAEGFLNEPIEIALPMPLSGNSWAETNKANEDSSDQSDFQFTWMLALEDIAGDGIVDILTETDRAEGLFDRMTRYALYPGRLSGGRLRFSADSSGELSVEGFGAQAELVDLDGNGAKDLGIGGVRLGLRRVVAALLTGATTLKLRIHAITEAERFAEEPLVERDLSIDFDLSRGNSTAPLVAAADFTGDGLKDLMVSDGDDEVKLYRNTGTGFDRSARVFDVDVPRNGQDFLAEDLNGDGRADLALPFDRLGADGEDNRTRLILLVSEPEDGES
ncbi:MAG: FG-GAP repeat domain-containing protein [Rhodothalassiaceae bacterium]